MSEKVSVVEALQNRPSLLVEKYLKEDETRTTEQIFEQFINEYAEWAQNLEEKFSVLKQQIKDKLAEIKENILLDCVDGGYYTSEIDRVFGLLDSMASDEFVVIKGKSLEDFYKKLISKICTCMDIELNESVNALDIGKQADCGLTELLEWVQSKRELLGC